MLKTKRINIKFVWPNSPLRLCLLLVQLEFFKQFNQFFFFKKKLCKVIQLKLTNVYRIKLS